MTDAQIIEQQREACKRLNYPFFEKGNYNFNFHAIRKKSANEVDYSNTFDDELRLSFKESGVWKLIRTKWTTVAGTLGKGGVLNPLTGLETGTGVDGTAVILPGFYKSVYQFIDRYDLFPFYYPVFMQVGNFDYYRDNDKDLKITKGKVFKNNYATWLHAMSRVGAESDTVNFAFGAWSQGCNGSPEPQFRQILAPTRQAVKIWGDKFSYAIFEEEQL